MSETAEVDHRTNDQKCFDRAVARGQGTFTVVEQDVTASGTICDWISRNIETAPAGKLREALELAIKFRSFSGRKAAD